jgi:hypothetical protein
MNTYEILRHNRLWILTWTNPDGRICTEKMGPTVTKKEYIETLSVEQLRELLETMLVESSQINFVMTIRSTVQKPIA